MSKLEISSILKDGLAKLSMLSNDTPSIGLKFVSNIDVETNNYIKIHLLDAKKHNAIAVYFRYFEERPPIPQIYIYEENKLNDGTVNDLHKELWSSCKVPMFFIFSKTEIKIFNSLSKDIKTTDVIPIDIIDIISTASHIKKEFQAKMFDTGDFWNTSVAQNFSYNKSAYESLLTSLRIARNHLISKSTLDKSIINSLIIKSILIRYLEEREVFEINYWEKFAYSAKSFIDVCAYKTNNQHIALVNLFDDLSSHFNGGVFKQTNYEKEQILNSDLTHFILFLRGDINIKTLQRHFWNLYSFKDLPIELISNIYELFLENKKGVVYTPSILVDFIIDEVMPLNEPQNNYKVIDPACGSGVFLVAAYKRHIQWWLIQNNFQKPSVNILKSIIRNNIFGIDIKAEAIELAKFSLSLSLCDTLSPEVIWNELHFDDLTKNGNLFAEDFFNIIDNEFYKESFDLVIGNPPFIAELTTPKSIEIEKESINKYEKRPKLPNNQLALLFLEQSFKICKKNQYICMIQPSAFLYTNNTKPFRDYLFQKFTIKQIVDFAGLNKSLFKKSGSNANVAISVSFFQNKEPDIANDELLHLTIKETFESKEKLYFNLSYYDFHWITYNEALENKYIWKSNLIGGGRTVDIVKRLSQCRTFDNFLEENKVNGWLYNEGYSLGNRKTEALYLHNHLTLNAKKIPLTKNGIDWSKTYTLNEKNFERPREKELYQAPLVLIRKTLDDGSMALDYSSEDIVFSNSFIGLSAPQKYSSDLKQIVHNLKFFNFTYVFYLIATSGKIGMDRDEVLLKHDIDILPYPENKESLKLSKIEGYYAEDTINYMLDWIRGVSVPSLFKDVDNFQLEEYTSIYCDLLNTMYDYYKPLKILQTEQFVIASFYYKTKPKEYLQEGINLDKDLENLIYENTENTVIIKKILKIYDKNVIYIIKPKLYRFWLKSIAVRDADDTFSDLIEMRY